MENREKKEGLKGVGRKKEKGKRWNGNIRNGKSSSE